ncbi:serine/threonine-protein kinase/endoribonuclease IRE1-like isoform X3 [Scomber scombrus]|uniref:Serine/threonine-protein kinase/endoribonuclease IRE1-like isoform X3 n=1 Tax=Scomber scombrus TaxID=13677 RepID=A0AAV1QM59_SCOSC
MDNGIDSNIPWEDSPGSKEEKMKKKQKPKKQETPNNEACTTETASLTVPVMESTSNVKPFNASKSSPPKHRCFQNSKRWREELDKVFRADETQITRVGCIYYLNDPEFCIAKGSDGIEIFLGLRDDDTEVAIKRMSKLNNFQLLKNEEKMMRLPGFKQSYIVQYKHAVEDENFQYLCLELFECTLEEYIKDCPEDKLYRIVKFILKAVKVLHDQDPPIFHWDLSLQNFWIHKTDDDEWVGLAGFGLCRWSPVKQTTLYTGRAEAKDWKPNKTSSGEVNRPYNQSSDIQRVGMLIDYILSRGQHPHQCQNNTHERKYSLRRALAKDLSEKMTDKKPENRPGAQECLNHPLFWPRTKKVEYLRRFGNRKEVEKLRDASLEFISSLEAPAGVGSFKEWKKKFEEKGVPIHWLGDEKEEEEKNKKKKREREYPDNVLGLLRYNRNFHEHGLKYLEKVDVILEFPLLFECAYKYAESQRWNSELPLEEMFTTGDAFSTRGVVPPTTSEDNLSVPVQEFQQVFTKPIAKDQPL